MSVSVSISAGAAVKATLSAKLTDHVSAKRDLKDFFGMFKSGKSNDATTASAPANLPFMPRADFECRR